MLDVLKKSKAKVYLVEVLRGADDVAQRQLVRDQVAVHYRDETNAFQELLPRLILSCDTESQSNVLEEIQDLTYSKAMANGLKQYKLLHLAAGEKEIEEYYNSNEFKHQIETETAKELQETFADKAISYYILVKTDDFEYQRELSILPIVRAIY